MHRCDQVQRVHTSGSGLSPRKIVFDFHVMRSAFHDVYNRRDGVEIEEQSSPAVVCDAGCLTAAL